MSHPISRIVAFVLPISSWTICIVFEAPIWSMILVDFNLKLRNVKVNFPSIVHWPDFTMFYDFGFEHLCTTWTSRAKLSAWVILNINCSTHVHPSHGHHFKHVCHRLANHLSWASSIETRHFLHLCANNLPLINRRLGDSIGIASFLSIPVLNSEQPGFLCLSYIIFLFFLLLFFSFFFCCLRIF